MSTTDQELVKNYDRKFGVDIRSWDEFIQQSTMVNPDNISCHVWRQHRISFEADAPSSLALANVISLLGSESEYLRDQILYPLVVVQSPDNLTDVIRLLKADNLDSDSPNSKSDAAALHNAFFLVTNVNRGIETDMAAGKNRNHNRDVHERAALRLFDQKSKIAEQLSIVAKAYGVSLPAEASQEMHHHAL